MTPEQIAKRRRRYFFFISAIATVITLVSASATYSINEKSFADWTEAGWFLALLATVGVEVTFTLVLFGIVYIFAGRAEQGIGVALLIGTLTVMATNYVTHHKLTTRARLSEWQNDYIQWVGPLTLFGILALIVCIIIFNHDARERMLDIAYAFAARRKAFEWRQRMLESAEFDQHMEQFKPQVFEEARRSLQLPALPAAKPAIGLAPPNERGSDDPNA